MKIVTPTIEPVWDCIEAARFLRLHPKTVKRMARLGQIPGCRLGRRWFFRPSFFRASEIPLPWVFHQLSKVGGRLRAQILRHGWQADD